MGQNINQNFSFDMLHGIYLIGQISGHNEKAAGEECKVEPVHTAYIQLPACISACGKPKN